MQWIVLCFLPKGSATYKHKNNIRLGSPLSSTVPPFVLVSSTRSDCSMISFHLPPCPFELSRPCIPEPPPPSCRLLISSPSCCCTCTSQSPIISSRLSLYLTLRMYANCIREAVKREFRCVRFTSTLRIPEVFPSAWRLACLLHLFIMDCHLSPLPLHTLPSDHPAIDSRH